MRADRATLLQVLREPRAILDLDIARLDLVMRQLRRLRLIAHVATVLERDGLIESLDSRVRDQMQSALVIARARARLAFWELDRLVRVLQPDAQFPVVVLKGCAYLMLGLPHAPGRVLTDVDLLVPEARLAEVESLLHAAGWEGAPLPDYDERYYREWAHEIPPLRHVDREMEVDVHHNILQRTARLKPDAALLLRDAREVGPEGLRVLCPPDMVLHAMVHLFHSSEMDDALRELVDIDALIRHFSAQDAAFWPAFAERARALGLQRPVSHALRYCTRWLQTDVPDAVLADLRADASGKLARAMMDALVPGALFARHPDHPERGAAIARLLLLARTQWIRMPPLLLLRHWAHKMRVRMQRRGEEAQ